jgi:hypothetical protein
VVARRHDDGRSAQEQRVAELHLQDGRFFRGILQRKKIRISQILSLT